MPIRSPIGDLGPLGDFLVKIGPLLVPFYTKSPLSRFLKMKIYLNKLGLSCAKLRASFGMPGFDLVW